MVGREFTIITRYFSPILRLLAFSGYVKSEKFQLVISAILQLLCCQSKKYKKSPGFSVTKMIINSRNPKQIIFSSIILLVVSVRSFSYHSLKSWHLEPQRQTLFFPRRLMSLIRACWAWERGVRTSISLYSSTCDMMISSMVNGMFSSRALRTSRDSRGANNLSSFLATRTRLAIGWVGVARAKIASIKLDSNVLLRTTELRLPLNKFRNYACFVCKQNSGNPTSNQKFLFSQQT